MPYRHEGAATLIRPGPDSDRQLLDSATTEKQLQIPEHYIEVVELGPIDPEIHMGSYAMRLFPEVPPDRGFDFVRGTDAGQTAEFLTR